MQENSSSNFDVHYELCRRTKFLLMGLLLVLNFIMRIPSIPHEKGQDSFYIHSLANSITSFGQANWWVNWLSIFGLYPYSYASSVPFSLSGIAQLTGIKGTEMEITILTFSVILGLFSVFTAYILAGVIYDDFLFKYLTAFFFSLCQGVMVFTTWEVSSRGMFIVFVPFFIFILLKKLKITKTFMLLIILIVFLAATHHYFYFLIIFLFTFLVLKLLQRFNAISNKENYFNYLYIIVFIFLFSVPFFTGFLIEAGSRYEWILTSLMISIRYIGPSLIFLFGGLFCLIFRKGKKFEEIYFLVSSLIIGPTIYSQTYGIYILLTFIIVFISVGFRNLLSLYETKLKSNKKLALFILLILLSFTSFSGFYNHVRTGYSQGFWYMPESTYKAAVWSNNYIPGSSHGIGLSVNGGETGRLIPTSNAHPIAPLTSAQILAYNLMNESDIQLEKVDSNSLDYYFEGPYVLKRGTDINGLINWFAELPDIDDKRAIKIIRRFNATYILDDIYAPTPIVYSLGEKKNNVFNSGRIRVWTI